MGELKVTIRFSQRETMTANESVLSKDVKIIPTLSGVKLTDKDGKMIRNVVEQQLGKKLGQIRYLARKRNLS